MYLCILYYIYRYCVYVFIISIYIIPYIYIYLNIFVVCINYIGMWHIKHIRISLHWPTHRWVHAHQSENTSQIPEFFARRCAIRSCRRGQIRHKDVARLIPCMKCLGVYTYSKWDEVVQYKFNSRIAQVIQVRRQWGFHISPPNARTNFGIHDAM